MLPDPVQQASALATRLHAGQVDKAGHPYIEHLRRVAAIHRHRWPDAVLDEVEACWLHDAVEDTEATAAMLLDLGVSPRAVEIVEALTKPDGASYLDWIRRLAGSGDHGAIRVKLADNEDNRDPARVAALPDGERVVQTRYEPARVLLEAALEQGHDGR